MNDSAWRPRGLPLIDMLGEDAGECGESVEPEQRIHDVNADFPALACTSIDVGSMLEPHARY